jgi:hypothetical protein
MGVNSLGVSTNIPSTGPAGRSGRGISSLNFVDNNDGSVTITVNLDDGSTQGPFTGTLTSDSLVALNELTLTRTNLVTKFLVQNSSGAEVFKVDTVNSKVFFNRDS